MTQVDLAMFPYQIWHFQGVKPFPLHKYRHFQKFKFQIILTQFQASHNSQKRKSPEPENQEELAEDSGALAEDNSQQGPPTEAKSSTTPSVK